MSEKDPSKLSRRRFLKQANCAAMGSSALFSTLLNLKMANKAAAQGSPEDYKAIVCLFLGGGIDSYNLVVPRDVEGHAEYATIRSDLALPRGDLLSLNGTLADARQLGFHPAMTGLTPLFNSGNAAVVNNVGTLVEAGTTLSDYQNGTKKLPFGIFSHSDQQLQWQTSLTESRAAVGWGGRAADILQSENTNQNISMNISMAGTNIFQTGNTVVPFAVNPYAGGASNEIIGFDNQYDPLSPFRTAAINSMLDEQYVNLFQQTYVDTVRQSLTANDDFSQALSSVNITTEFDQGNRLARSFETTARVLAARGDIGAARQTFFISDGGWDNHDEVINAMQGNLTDVDGALTQFWAALGELGLQDKVTVFTVSDFARTLTSNGRGSDHAWGGNHIVMGGAVNGGQFYGTYPELHEGNPLDTGRGRLIPTLSVDEYLAEIAMWFGVSNADLPTVFPNLSEFHSIGSGNPVGFMNLT